MITRVGKYLCLFFVAVATLALEQAVAQEVASLSKDDPAYREGKNDDPETRLLKERVRAVLEEIESIRVRVNNGQENIRFLYDAQRRLVSALLDFHKDPKTIISLLEQNVELTKILESEEEKRVNAGLGPPENYAQARYFRADAELQLLRAKKKYKLGGDE